MSLLEGRSSAALARPRPVAQIIRALEGHRLPIGREADFHGCVAEVLTRAGFVAQPEYSLGPGLGRIDFFVPLERVGIELKVKGSPSGVAEQLLRYMASPQVASLILVTGRAALGALPRVLGGKPLYIASVWKGLL